MKSVYFNHKRGAQKIGYMNYLRLAESEHRISHRNQKWTAPKADLASRCYVAPNEGLIGVGGCSSGCGDCSIHSSGNQGKQRYNR